MHRRTILTTVLAAVLVVGLAAAAVAAPPSPRNFVAQLSGDQEATPVDTNARGLAKFQLSRDGTELDFRLNVANIEDVVMAHIHLGGPDQPVVVWLVPEGPPPPDPIEGRSSGPLATGTITDDSLAGPLAGAGLDALVDVLLAGEGWVNVHTAEEPGGEIAGQIQARGSRAG